MPFGWLRTQKFSRVGGMELNDSGAGVFLFEWRHNEPKQAGRFRPHARLCLPGMSGISN